MLEIDISSDIDRVFSEVGDFFRDQIPFAAAGALNDTAFDIRRRIVGSTWPKAVTMRNRVFAGKFFRVLTPLANKNELMVVVGNIGRIGLSGDFNYLEALADGGTKVPRGNWIAIPVKNALRNRGGSIPKSQKPMNLKNTFIRSSKDGKSRVIIQRSGGETWARYILVKRAQIPATFRFEQDATDTALRVFSGHFGTRLALAISKSRVFE